ncbi:MAG: phosphotransferase, partial [Pseudonocardiales bacterium]
VSASAQITTRFVRFPPGRHNVLLPTRPRSAMAQAMAMYTPANIAPRVALRGLWLTARVGGSRLVPGPRIHWRPELPVETFAALRTEWATAAGRAIEALAVYERPQATRASLVVLVCAGSRSMLVRIRRDRASLDVERRISLAAERIAPMTFRVPAVVGEGEIDGWHWIGYEVISRGPHRPYRADAEPLAGDIERLVATVLDRPAGTPHHWRAAHGDLTPWNLRLVRGHTWLIDWEDARWAPPGTDAVYLAATRAAVRRGPAAPRARPAEHEEAARLWLETVRRRLEVDGSSRLNERLLVLLGRKGVGG